MECFGGPHDWWPTNSGYFSTYSATRPLYFYREWHCSKCTAVRRLPDNGDVRAALSGKGE